MDSKCVEMTSDGGTRIKPFPGKIAVMGGGSWATALAKLLLQNVPSIIWYMRRPDRISEFKRLGHNPAYLSDVEFPIERIDFRDDINEACRDADTLLMAMPSPYFKSHLAKLTTNISDKDVVIATKGIIPDENMLISDYIEHRYGITPDRITVVSAPLPYRGMPRHPTGRGLRGGA